MYKMKLGMQIIIIIIFLFILFLGTVLSLLKVYFKICDPSIFY